MFFFFSPAACFLGPVGGVFLGGSPCWGFLGPVFWENCVSGRGDFCGFPRSEEHKLTLGDPRQEVHLTMLRVDLPFGIRLMGGCPI